MPEAIQSINGRLTVFAIAVYMKTVSDEHCLLRVTFLFVVGHLFSLNFCDPVSTIKSRTIYYVFVDTILAHHLCLSFRLSAERSPLIRKSTKFEFSFLTFTSMSLYFGHFLDTVCFLRQLVAFEAGEHVILFGYIQD